MGSHFLLSTNLHVSSPTLFVTSHPFWLQSELGTSVATLIVGCILCIAGPPQMPALCKDIAKMT